MKLHLEDLKIVQKDCNQSKTLYFYLHCSFSFSVSALFQDMVANEICSLQFLILAFNILIYILTVSVFSEISMTQSMCNKVSYQIHICWKSMHFNGCFASKY